MPSPQQQNLTETKQKSDLEIINQAKLTFPKQPFLNDLGKQSFTPINTIEKTSYSPPIQNTIETATETESYKLLDRKTLKPDLQGQDIFTKIEIKDPRIDLTMSTETRVNEVTGVVNITKDSLELAKRFTNYSPTSAEILGPEKYLEFQDKEGNKFLISPRFALQEMEKKTLEVPFLNEIAELRSKLKERSENIKPSLDSAEKIAESRKVLDSVKSELEKELGIDLSMVSMFGVQGKDKLSEAGKIKLKDYEEKLKILKDAESDRQEVHDLESKIDLLVQETHEAKNYTGILKDGTKVQARFVPSTQELTIYNLNNKQIGCEKKGSSFQTSTGEFIFVYETVLPNGISTVSTAFPSEYPRINETRSFDSEKNLVKIETFDDKNRPAQINLYELGIIETFSDGQISSVEVSDPRKVLANSAMIQKNPNWDDIIIKAASLDGHGVLENFKQIENNPNLSQILEAGIGGLHPESLENTRLRLEEILETRKTNPEISNLQDIPSDKMQEVLDLVVFRKRMIDEGIEITRDITNNRGTAFTGAQIWNDPKSRGYFEIEDQWINWEDEKIKPLLDTENASLSKNELKLLAARLIFDRNEPVNKENTLNALETISNLRNEYLNLDLIKDRNIVFAAHADTAFGSNFISSRDANDVHIFGKGSLIDLVKTRQGNEHSFTLLRDEWSESLDKEEVHKIVRNTLGKNENLTQLLEKIDDNARKNNGIYEVKNILNELESEINSQDADKIISSFKGTGNERLDQVKNVKEQILEQIRNTPPPFTFIFDGHGSPDAIYLTDGSLNEENVTTELQSTVKITSEEFSEALKVRNINFGSRATESKDVYIFQNCYNFNFIRDVSGQIENQGNSLFLGSAEYNQFSYFYPRSNYSSLFLSDVVADRNFESMDELVLPKTTVDGVLKRQYLDFDPAEMKENSYESDKTKTNPSLFVPNEAGEIIQIGSLVGDEAKFV